MKNKKKKENMKFKTTLTKRDTSDKKLPVVIFN